MIEIREGSLHFPEANHNNAASVMEFFAPRQVVRCWVALRGYDVRFRDLEDHKVAVVQVSLECDPSQSDIGPGVRVDGRLRLCDDDGNPRSIGTIDYLLFVELEEPQVHVPVHGPNAPAVER